LVFDASFWLQLSVIASSVLLAVTVWLMGTMLRLSFRHLQNDLSKVDQSLRLCASALLKIAGDNSTEEYSERQVGE